LRGFFFRVFGGVGEQGIGQRGQAGFDGDLGLGAALHLVRQVQVFEACLVFGMHDRVQQFGRHFPLLLD